MRVAIKFITGIIFALSLVAFIIYSTIYSIKVIIHTIVYMFNLIDFVTLLILLISMIGSMLLYIMACEPANLKEHK
jgi:hypothetical protein